MGSGPTVETRRDWLGRKSLEVSRNVVGFAVLMWIVVECVTSGPQLQGAISTLQIQSFDSMLYAIGERKKVMQFTDAVACVSGLLAIVATFNVAVAALTVGARIGISEEHSDVGTWMKKVILAVRLAAAISVTVSLTQLGNMVGGFLILLLMSCATVVACDLLVSLEMRFHTARERLGSTGHRHVRAMDRVKSYKQGLPLGLRYIGDDLRRPRQHRRMYCTLTILILVLTVVTVGILAVTMQFVFGSEALASNAMLLVGAPMLTSAAASPCLRASKALAPKLKSIPLLALSALSAAEVYLLNPVGDHTSWVVMGVGSGLGFLIARLGRAELPVVRNVYLIPLAHLIQARKAASRDNAESVREMRRVRHHLDQKADVGDARSIRPDVEYTQ